MTRTLVLPNLKPTGCYTTVDGTTYRYRNIMTVYNDTFSCSDKKFGLYSVYVDDEMGTGEEAVYKVCCQDGEFYLPLNLITLNPIAALLMYAVQVHWLVSERGAGVRQPSGTNFAVQCLDDLCHQPIKQNSEAKISLKTDHCLSSGDSSNPPAYIVCPCHHSSHDASHFHFR
jgi:hypothetical protein